MAGVRYRCLNPLRVLQARGYPIELYDPVRADRYSAVLFQALCCRQDPANRNSGDYILDEATRLRDRGVSILIDECDNHFFNPKQDSAWVETASRIRSLIGISDHLVASTSAVADVLRAEGGKDKPISIIGDAVESGDELDEDPTWKRLLSWRRKFAQFKQTMLRQRLASQHRQGMTHLVWYGNHGTSYADGGMLDLLKVKELLERLNHQYPLSLTVISNNEQKFQKHIAHWDIPTRYVEWDKVTFLPLLRAHDIALIPVSRNPFTICKSNNRLTLALNEGLAVVADSIPSYQEFSSACHLDNWEYGLQSYLESETLRREHVSHGRNIIASKWMIAGVATEWERLFDLITILA